MQSEPNYETCTRFILKTTKCYAFQVSHHSQCFQAPNSWTARNMVPGRRERKIVDQHAQQKHCCCISAAIRRVKSKIWIVDSLQIDVSQSSRWVFYDNIRSRWGYLEAQTCQLNLFIGQTGRHSCSNGKSLHHLDTICFTCSPFICPMKDHEHEEEELISTGVHLNLLTLST